MVVSEYAMYLWNRHLWLGEKDADWHVPLNIIIKPSDVGNQRKRTDERREERMRRYLDRVGKGKEKGNPVQAEKGKGKGTYVLQEPQPELVLPPWARPRETWQSGWTESGWRSTSTGSSSSATAALPKSD